MIYNQDIHGYIPHYPLSLGTSSRKFISNEFFTQLFSILIIFKILPKPSDEGFYKITDLSDSGS